MDSQLISENYSSYQASMRCDRENQTKHQNGDEKTASQSQYIEQTIMPRPNPNKKHKVETKPSHCLMVTRHVLDDIRITWKAKEMQ